MIVSQPWLVIACYPVAEEQIGKQEAANIAGMGEPHDPINVNGVNQDSENEHQWTPSNLLDLGQNDQDG